MAWRCQFLAARPSQDGHVIAEKRLSEELSVHPTHWLISTQARAEREKRAVAPLIFRVACDDGMLGDVPLRKGDGVVASLRLAPDLSFGAGRRACAGREVALAVAAAAVEARLSDGVAKIA